MLMSAVVHPDALEEKNFDDTGHYRRGILSFLRGMLANGVILDGPHGLYEKAFEEQVKVLRSLPSTKVGTRNLQAMDFILRHPYGLKKFIRCKEDPLENDGYSLRPLSDASGSHFKADAFFDPDSLMEYEDSEFQEKRLQYAGFNKSLHRIVKRQEIDEIIMRSVRFSKWLRFYDSQLGKAKKNESNDKMNSKYFDPYYSYKRKCKRFCEGFKYIVGVWAEHGHFVSKDPKDNVVEIITPCEAGLWCNAKDTSGRLAEELAKRLAAERLRETRDVLRETVILPLESEFAVSVSVSLRRDPNRVDHYRCLETESVVLSFDKGFDLFQDGTGRRNDGPNHKRDRPFDSNQVALGDPERCAEYKELPMA